MTNTLIRKIAFFFSALICSILIFISCKGIKDFMEAIDKYGYKSSEPLGPKSTKVDPTLFGGYVFKSLPLIIEQKDQETYLIKFLSMELDEQDVVIEAYTTDLGRMKFMNLNLVGTFAFLKINGVFNNKIEIGLVRDLITPYVKGKSLKNWLLENGEKDLYMSKDSIEIAIYYDFTFDKISQEKAYEMQARELSIKKTRLFESCYSYYTYSNLEKKYPGDPLLPVARESLLSVCHSIKDYEDFIKYFPGDPLCETARYRIHEIQVYKQDSTNYYAALSVNTINELILFTEGSSTKCFIDSAMKKINMLANSITQDDVEWKWTGGAREEALQMIFHKIDYSTSAYDASWYRERLTFYCLSMKTKETGEKALQCLDKLANKKPPKNQLLDLYVSKGFLLWSLERIDLAIEVFRSRISETYDAPDSMAFGKKIVAVYNSYKESGITFPDEKKTWKKIKKLK